MGCRSSAATPASRILELAGVPEVKARATELAHEAVTAVANPAYRSTSIGRAGRTEAGRAPLAGAA